MVLRVLLWFFDSISMGYLIAEKKQENSHHDQCGKKKAPRFGVWVRAVPVAFVLLDGLLYPAFICPVPIVQIHCTQ